MTKKEVLKLIEASQNGNYVTFRENCHMHLVLNLLFFCHLMPAYIYRLRPCDITQLPDGTGIGRYMTERYGRIHEFEFDEIIMYYLKEYIDRFRVSENDYIIQVDSRGMRKLFKKMTDSFQIEGTLIDVYYSGLNDKS